MDYICKEKCFYRNRLYTPGMKVLGVLSNEKLPRFFVKEKDYTPIHKEEAREHLTFAEMQREDAEQALRAVGHRPESEKKAIRKSGKKDSVDSLLD